MDKTLPPLTQAVTGALGAGISSALIYPLDLLTTRLQTANRDSKSVGQYRTTLPCCADSLKRYLSGLFALIRLILNREGVAGLFRGQ